MMEETDVGRVLAAAAPETVPERGDLPERVRVLGRRRRRQRAFMTGAGASVAAVAVAGAVVGLGGFGNGKSASTNAGPGGAPVVSSHPTTAHTTATTPPTKPATPSSSASLGGGGLSPTSAEDAKVLAAVKAALPPADAAVLTLYRAADDKTGYAAEYRMGQQGVVSVDGGANGTGYGTPSQCTSDPSHCTKGTATLHGDPVRWELYTGNSNSVMLDVFDDQQGLEYSTTIDFGSGSVEPWIPVVKGVGLNEQVAAAELEAWGGLRH